MLEGFVRDTLGCGCPTEVFKHIDLAHLNQPIIGCPTPLRVDIGGRLLLYLMRQVSTPLTDIQLLELLNRGVEDRNLNGFNRLRIVIGSNASPAFASDYQALLKSHFPSDDKLNIHQLPSAVIPVLET